MRTKVHEHGLLLTTLAAAGFSLAMGSGAHAGVAINNPGFCAGEGCLTPAAALANPDPMKVSFDEWGRALIEANNGPEMTLTGALGDDPTEGAGGTPVLIYKLPQPVISGTVFFTQPGAGTGVYSDALRFTDSTGQIGGGVTNGTLMIFYSDIESADLNPALADTGIPETGGNWITRKEVGCEVCLNGFDYQPGGVPYPGNNEYVGVSDYAAPELSTWAMMVVGFAGLSYAGYRAKAKPSLLA